MLVGFLFDIVGRKYTLIVLWFSSGIAVYLMPYTSPIVYPWFFLCKVFFSIVFQPIGAILVNDVSTTATRGRAFSF
jgi:MFS family permease